MRAISTALVTLSLLALTAAGAGAADKDKFLSLIGKYAADGTGSPAKFSPKTPCFCTGVGGGIANAAGWVVHYTGGDGLEYLNCYFPYFGADGSLQAYGYCNGFQVLAK